MASIRDIARIAGASPASVSRILGSETQLYCKVGNTDLVSKVDTRDFTKPGATVKMGFEMNKAHFFDPETTKAIR